MDTESTATTTEFDSPGGSPSRSVAGALDAAHELALRYVESLPDRHVGGTASRDALLDALGGLLPEGPDDPAGVVRRLADAADPGLVATSSGRFFGFVEGGVLPAALAADWLTSVWDQNPGFSVLSPAAAAAEEVVAGWMLDLLGLPPSASVGFTTGAQMASLAGLAAARHHVLAAVGWDAEADGLIGAPRVKVVVGDERHATIGRALRFLGFGERTVTVVPADGQGRMDAGALGAELARDDGPAIVCAQAGNVNTGAFDPLRAIGEATREHGAWLHVDGAFGLWAAASPRLRHLADGIELADSWATDGHKWLNVPYDSGIVVCAHPDAHRTALALHAPYLIRNAGNPRDGSDWTAESSRRARVFALWAALRSLGRTGVAGLVERCCDHARRFADELGGKPGFEVLNEVVLNQVLVRVGDDDQRTRAVAHAVQREGVAWLGETTRHGVVALRISVSDHATTEADVDRAIDAIVRAAS
ncbi:MAG TPA: aminotransferase class V-fold PLP-dependent enzyme [Actinomycetota bacterium]|nr:aminotransferase class V-fold PLP-dependent enzyme [Actinomycetota bacterium]